jgi:ankyrin repeat protein
MQDKLLELVIHRKHNELKNILIEYPIELSKILYMDGWTLLHFAVIQGDYCIMETLLRFGINVDLPTSGMMRTPLHEASIGNKVELVKLLI